MGKEILTPITHFCRLVENNLILSRRDFIRLEASLGLNLLFPPEKLDPNELYKFPPNPNLPAVGFSIVPDSLVTHYRDEPVVITMNYGDLVIGGYGEGFKHALGPRTLKIEQYPKDKKLTPEEWKNYDTQVIFNYQGIERAIIGNECNSPILESYMPPREYASVYETAYQVIKTLSPQTIVSLYGEANDDETHSHLREVLKILKEQGIRPDEGSTHFYDHSKKLNGWLKGYQDILNEFFNGVPIHVSEMGKQISIPVSDEQQAALMVQDLALAAAYAEQGRISFAAWFAAASFKKDQSDSIFRFSETVNGRLETSHLVIPWYLTTKALHHNVRLMEGRGITIVSGQTADNRSSLVVWNKTNQPLPCLVPINRSAYNLYGTETSPQNGLVLLPSTKYPDICFGNPVFFF